MPSPLDRSRSLVALPRSRSVELPLRPPELLRLVERSGSLYIARSLDEPRSLRMSSRDPSACSIFDDRFGMSSSRLRFWFMRGNSSSAQGRKADAAGWPRTRPRRYHGTFMTTLNSFGSRTEIRVGGRPMQIYSLPALEKAGFPGV